MIVASRMPTSATRSGPYLAWSPANPWLTSPILPTSSPKAIRFGIRARAASKQALTTSKPLTIGASGA